MTRRLAKTGSTRGPGASSGHKTVTRITVMAIGAGILSQNSDHVIAKIIEQLGHVLR